MKFKNIYNEEKEAPDLWDLGGVKVQVLDIIQFDRPILIFQETKGIADDLERQFCKEQLN